MSRLPTVLFLHPSDELYGADRSLRSLVLAARDLMHPVVVLPKDLPYRGELSASLRADGIEVVIGPVPVVRRRYLTPLRAAPWAVRACISTMRLIVLARRRRARAIVSNTTAVMSGPIVARLVGVPHLWYVREIVDSPHWYRSVVSHLSRLSRGSVIAVSQAVASWLGRIPGHGPVVMYNGVDVFGDPLPLPETPRAIFVGRFNGWKGQEVFIQAASMAHERVPDATFALVGGAVPNDQESALAVERQTRSIDPDGRWLQLVGELPDSRAAMRDAWLVAVPSTLPDPLPNVVLEAMAEGRAVVGSDLGGIPEMVSSGRTGELVRPGDARSLANAMAGILGNRRMAESLGEEGRMAVDERFSRQRSRLAWRTLLMSTVGSDADGR